MSVAINELHILTCSLLLLGLDGKNMASLYLLDAYFGRSKERKKAVCTQGITTSKWLIIGISLHCISLQKRSMFVPKSLLAAAISCN